jgi:hypothetical protein
MKVASSKNRLLQLIRPKAPQLSSLSPADGIAVMLAFYHDERAEGCEIDEDGDMLLYQWGCYDWGQGEYFDFNITRQFMDAAGEKIQQLSLAFKFKPTDSLRNLADGNRWCHSPDEVSEFRLFIESSAAYNAVANAKPTEIALDMQAEG